MEQDAIAYTRSIAEPRILDARQTGQIDEANRLQGLLDDAIDDSAEYVAEQRNEL